MINVKFVSSLYYKSLAETSRIGDGVGEVKRRYECCLMTKWQILGGVGVCNNMFNSF